MFKLLKKLLLIIFPLIILGFSTKYFSAYAQEKTINQPQEILFVLDGCSHCEKVLNFIQENNLQSKLIIKELHNSQNIQEFNAICDKFNIPTSQRGVPFLVTEQTYLQGDQAIINYLESKYISQTSNLSSSSLQDTQNNTNQKSNQGISIGMLILAALADAINPCAFAVLLLLLSTLIAKSNNKKTKKILLYGLAFSSAIFISYFSMGLGLFHALTNIVAVQTFKIIISIFAIIIGLLNLKDYFAYGKIVLMEVPLFMRPKLKQIIKSVTSIPGAFITGFAVSLFLLPCTSGPYLYVLGLLATGKNIAYATSMIFLYNLIFVSPMLIITWLVYKGLSVENAESTRKKYIKHLHLIAGTILVLLGIITLMATI